MTITTPVGAGTGQLGWRPCAWGAVGAMGALAGAVAVGREAARAWLDVGSVGFATDLLGAMLALGAALLLWVSVVLLAAAWQLRPEARPTTTPRSGSPAVRLAAAVLVSLASGVAGGAGAHAAPVSAPALAQAEGTSPWHRSSAPAPAEGHATASQHLAPAADDAWESDPRLVDAREGGSDQVDVPLPGWTPRAPGAGPRAPGQIGLVSGAPADDLPERVVVRRGDTLWDLAARALGPGATSADIAQEWPRWYAANLATIGPDPDLLLPGQELVVPGTSEGR